MLDINGLVAEATAIRDRIQAAITAGEHVVKTANGVLNSPQLVVAAGSLSSAISNLKSHGMLLQDAAKQAQIDIVKAKIAAAKTLGQDPSEFEAELIKLQPPANQTTTAPAAPAAAAS